MRLRLMSLLLIIMLLVMAVPANAAYENTYTNTGDQRADIIGVALTQVGYREGNNNYTKYGAWYGYPNHPWCGMFVSWCANQAGIPTSVIKKAGRANPWDFGFSTYYTGYEYTPKPGDLYFNKEFGHMGIVYYVDGSYVYSIEGNTNDSGYEGVGVFIRKHKVKDLYYVSPNYRSDASHSYHKGYENEHPHKEYFRCSHCGDKYYTGNYTTVSDCRTCIVENCSHSYSSWKKDSSSKHYRICSKCDNRQTASHSWDKEKIIKEATCAQTGTKEQSCVCGATKTVTIPKSETHTFSEWKLLDEVSHTRECTVCKKKELEEHKLQENWDTDEKEHWKSCEVCKEKLTSEKHSFANCAAPCDTCEFKRATGHLFVQSFSSDEVNHWHACEGCAEKEGVEPHTYEAKSDDKGSWQECTACALVKDYKDHVPGPAATEETAQNCTLCGYELAPILEHVHAYMPMESDKLTHWGKCVCGDEIGPEPHVWDVSKGCCAVCQAPTPRSAQRQNWDFVWVWLGVAGVAGILITVVVTSVVSAKKRKLYV